MHDILIYRLFVLLHITGLSLHKVTNTTAAHIIKRYALMEGHNPKISSIDSNSVIVLDEILNFLNLAIEIPFNYFEFIIFSNKSPNEESSYKVCKSHS